MLVRSQANRLQQSKLLTLTFYQDRGEMAYSSTQSAETLIYLEAQINVIYLAFSADQAWPCMIPCTYVSPLTV